MTETEARNRLEILREDLNFLREELQSHGATISLNNVLTKPLKTVGDFDYEGTAAEFKAANAEYSRLLAGLNAISEEEIETYAIDGVAPPPPISPTLAGGSITDMVQRQNTVNESNSEPAPDWGNMQPFDPRLTRRDGLYELNGMESKRTPFAADTVDSVYWDMIDVQNSKPNMIQALDTDKNQYGLQSIINPYAVTRLYNGLDIASGEVTENRLLDIRDQHRFYDLNDADTNILAVANPTTTNIIRFGNADKWGRTPYSFQDFVFCKYWNVIPNNRIITLRKYGAPCVDSLNFEGMTTTDASTGYAPIATAVTFFGEGTDNKLSSLLKFTTGMRWDDLQSDVWTVTGEGSGTTQATDIMNNADGSFAASTLGYMAKLFALAGGEYNYERAMMEHGNLPQDPWDNGPYTNRLIGPANSIDMVKKRKRGLDFSMPLEVKFHYVSRPIGGVNAKAAMLDILANFLVMCSASAVFWGGANRFKINPQVYPFFGEGGQSVLQKLYRGKVFGDDGALAIIKNAVTSTFNQNNTTSFMQGLLGAVSGMLGKIFSITGLNGQVSDYLKGLGSEAGQQAGQNLGKGLIERISTKLLKTSIVPYMTGMRSLLIGEPVGDWHLTIGNPLNPIAVIGNLICTGMSVDFSEELGPDDFPMEMSITVKLDHGMPRDRDAIESMFNRGSGRIYNLPDTIRASSDFETTVDGKSGKNNKGSQTESGKGNGATWNERHDALVINTAGDSTWSYNQKVIKSPRYTTLNVPKFSPLDSNEKFNIKSDMDSRSVFIANIGARAAGLT